MAVSSRDSRTAYTVSGAAISATGTFRKKIHSQPAFSTSRPPTTGPMPSARPEMPAHRPSARPSSGPLKVLVMIESDPGIRNAAPAPCTPRKNTSSLIEPDSPAPIEPSVNTTSPARNMRLRPNTSPRRPPVTSRTPNTSV